MFASNLFDMLPEEVFATPPLTRYMRTSWMISADAQLIMSDSSKVRFMPRAEVNKLAELVRKRNVFARHSRENNFYLQRIREFADKTVLEVYRQGDPDSIYEEAENVARLLETLVILSLTLAMKKEDLHRKLGIRSRSRKEVDFVTDHAFRYLRSKTKPQPEAPGIALDERSCRRFEKCGFHTLYEFCVSSNQLTDRVLTSLDWLFESRKETELRASVVKSAIALESLLIFDGSEALARSLSERVAFIFTASPDVREKLSAIVKRFYNVRSGVVHGSKSKQKKLTPHLVEAMDRLCLLLCLVVASNSSQWITKEDLRRWCERQRWGTPATNIRIPFAANYLTNAIQLAEKS